MLLSVLLLAAASTVHGLAVSSLKYSIKASNQEVLSSDTISLDEKTLPALELGPTDVLKLTFTVLDKPGGKGVQPHQTFLRFYDEETHEEGVQPVRVTASGKAKFELNMARPPSSLPPTSTRPLSVSILLGSFTYSPFSAPIAKLSVPPSGSAPPHPEAASFSPLPEIHHTFRKEEKMPPAIVSVIGAGAVVGAPWLLLISLWASISPSAPNLFSSSILPFVVVLGALEGLLLWYWVALKLGDVLLYGAILAGPAMWAGRRALAEKGRRREGR